MKKLISIGVALALLVAFVVPVAVAADYPDDPGKYSKTPFAILGTGIQLVGELLGDLDGVIGAIAELPFPLADLEPIFVNIGEWTGVNMAWMTDMTGWSMVVAGDALSVVGPLAETMGFDDYIKPVADIFYVMGARVFDSWGDITSEGTADLPGPGIGLPVG